MWMIYDKEGMERNQDYVSWFQKICQPYGITCEAVLVDEIEEKLKNSNPHFVLVRTINPRINVFFEERNIPVFNNSFVSEICNHKGKTLSYLQGVVHAVSSATIRNEKISDIFDDPFYSDHLDEYVIKTVDGHGGKQVFRLNESKDKILQGCGKQDVVVQPLIDMGGKSRDLRVYVVGKKIIAAVLRESKEDFRANFSLGGTVRLYELSQEQREVVDQVIRKFDFGMVGIDFFLLENDILMLNEIEDVVGSRMLYQCAPDIDIAKIFLQYIMEEKLHIGK